MSFSSFSIFQLNHVLRGIQVRTIYLDIREDPYLRKTSTAFTLGDYSWKLVPVGTRRGWPRERHVSPVAQWRDCSGVDPYTRRIHVLDVGQPLVLLLHTVRGCVLRKKKQTEKLH